MGTYLTLLSVSLDMTRRRKNSMQKFIVTTYSENTSLITCDICWTKMKMHTKNSLDRSSNMELQQMIWKVYTPRHMLLFVRIPSGKRSQPNRLPRKDGARRGLLTMSAKRRCKRLKMNFSPRLRLKRNKCLSIDLCVMKNKHCIFVYQCMQQFIRSKNTHSNA